MDLIVLDQAIDTTTPSWRLLFNMLGAIAEFEADLVRERTRQGLEARVYAKCRLVRARPRSPSVLLAARRLQTRPEVAHPEGSCHFVPYRTSSAPLNRLSAFRMICFAAL